MEEYATAQAVAQARVNQLYMNQKQQWMEALDVTNSDFEELLQNPDTFKPLLIDTFREGTHQALRYRGKSSQPASQLHAARLLKTSAAPSTAESGYPTSVTAPVSLPSLPMARSPSPVKYSALNSTSPPVRRPGSRLHTLNVNLATGRMNTGLGQRKAQLLNTDGILMPRKAVKKDVYVVTGHVDYSKLLAEQKELTIDLRESDDRYRQLIADYDAHQNKIHRRFSAMLQPEHSMLEGLPDAFKVTEDEPEGGAESQAEA